MGDTLPIFDGQFRNRFQSRTLLRRGKKLIGKGGLVSKVQNRADKVSTRMKGRKPNIIPTVEETLGKWNVGSRITEMIPTPLKNRTESIVKPQVSKQSGSDISL